jgi:hypothetical protein
MLFLSGFWCVVALIICDLNLPRYVIGELQLIIFSHTWLMHAIRKHQSRAVRIAKWHLSSGLLWQLRS